MASPAEIISEHDKVKRIEDETIVLEKAHALTNGHAGDPKLTGEVLQWQVKETIAQSVLLRALVTAIETFQPKEQCALNHKPKSWPVKLFGFSFSAPVTSGVLIIGWLVFMACRKQGWM